jgi:hypothetical protein
MENVMEALLQCQVNRGMFSGKVAVRGKTAGGTEFSLFVPEDFVDASRPATGDETVEGWLRVDVLAREGALVLVRLPAQSFENGQTVTVRDDQIELRAHREAV